MSPPIHCICAARPALQPHQLASGLEAQRCGDCGNTLLALDDYRRWRERLPAGVVESADAGATEPVQEPGHARACPVCSRLMSRHRVGLSPDFHIDRCSPCQLVWLDDGEWQQLEQAGLLLQLDSVLTDAWQRRVQAEELRQRREADLRARIGDANYDEALRIRHWLASHPQRTDMMRLINGD